MNHRPLNLAILWHMHQPFYKDLVTGEFILPWVRLHAAKDYYDMVAVLDKFPNVKVNFNLVPSLLVQIDDYLGGKGKDKFLELTLKEPKDLTLDERVFILRNFFMANWENMIRPYPRYHDLLIKRGRFISPSELKEVAKRFSPKELLDLQVWFNLTWFGFIYKNDDAVISELIRKGKNFTEEDKRSVISKQMEIMGKVIPAYRGAQEKGQIEISTSPFYHPILPLVCDTNAAREAMPHIALPKVPFRHPEDAEAQIKMAVEDYRSRFGRDPQGMWPSEGSVSEQIIPLIARAGIKWIATDEGILSRSLQQSHSLLAEELYQPYSIEREGAALSMIFRNHFISDQVGFVYYRWKVGDAIDDFMHHVHNIRLSLPDDGKNYLLSVILDGENAWEYYHDQGKQFLESFYGRLSNDPAVKTVKIGEYLEENPPARKLNRLFAGSWINNNFRIWIGHEEDNIAWDYLHQARLALADSGNDPLAWQELYVAEGSDWCWWYGDDHSSDNDAEFDLLFRKHLKNIYQILKKEPPSYLELPIKKFRLIRPIKEPVYLIEPILDGKVTNYYEWLSAGHFDIAKARGAMHQIETILKDVYYGYSLKDLFVRLDLNVDLTREELQNMSFSILILNPVQYRIEFSFLPDEKRFAFRIRNNGDMVKELSTFAMWKVIELGVPFSDIGAKTGDKVEFKIVVAKEGQELERWPRDGAIDMIVPSKEYELEQWSV